MQLNENIFLGEVELSFEHVEFGVHVSSLLLLLNRNLTGGKIY